MKVQTYWYLIFYAIHIIGNYYLIVYTNKTNICEYQQLPDILLDTNIYFENLVPYMDILTLLFLIPLLFKNVFNNFEILFKFMGLVAFFRVICNFSTLLPCLTSRYEEQRSREDYLLNYVIGHNYDKIFSGHASLVILCVLITITNNLISDFSKLMMVILGIIYSILIVLTKQHYTVDVVLAYMIVIPLYFSIKDIV